MNREMIARARVSAAVIFNGVRECRSEWSLKDIVCESELELSFPSPSLEEKSKKTSSSPIGADNGAELAAELLPP